MIKNIWKNEDGATMVEYSLLVALIAVALIVVLGVLKNAISTNFSEAASSM